MTMLEAAAVLVVWIAFATFLSARAEAIVGAAPTLRMLLVTTSCALLAASAALTRPLPSSLACGFACVALVVAAFADARTGYLFDAVTMPAAALTATAAFVAGDVQVATMGVVALVGAFGTLVAASRGSLMGLGDVKAMYAIGAAFGPYESLVAVFAACACGIACATIERRFRRNAHVRFGPHLAAGSVFATLAGGPIVHGVLGL